jgi:hypothetical protein
MGRPKKTQVDLTADSFRSLLQEIYNDCNEQKRKALSDIKRRNVSFNPDDVTEEEVLSRANNNSLKIIDNAIKTKVELAKLQGQMISKAGVTSNDENQGAALTPDDIKMLLDLQKEDDEDKVKFNMK